MSVFIVRAFVKFREVLSIHKELSKKLKELEQKVGEHDQTIHAIIDTIRQLMGDSAVKKNKIGFERETWNAN